MSKIVGWKGGKKRGASPKGRPRSKVKSMPKRKTRTVSVPAARSSTVKIQMPRAPAAMKRRRGHRRRHGGGGRGERLTSQENLAIAAGGFVLGMLDKAGTHVPTIPMLGRAGSLALGAHYGGKMLHMPFVQKMAKGFIAIALYELGREGHIAGVDGFSDV